MKTAAINARISPQLKDDVESILSQLGISTTQAITMYFEQIKMNRGLPFAVKLPSEDGHTTNFTKTGWPEGYFAGLKQWEGDDLVRPEQGEYENRLDFE